MYIVEAREIGGNWYNFSSHSNENAAIIYAERCKRNTPDTTYRVRGSDGSTVIIL